MAVGTLRDQVIYPDNHAEQLRKGVKDQELADILEKVRIKEKANIFSRSLNYTQ